MEKVFLYIFSIFSFTSCAIHSGTMSADNNKVCQYDDIAIGNKNVIAKYNNSLYRVSYNDLKK